MDSVLFVTDNEAGGNAGREIVIVIRPLNGTEDAQRACKVFGDAIIDTLGELASGSERHHYYLRPGDIQHLGQASHE